MLYKQYHDTPARCCTVPATAARWNKELVKVLNAPDVREQLLKHGLTPTPGTREELAQFIRQESITWARVIKQGNITAD